MKSSVLLTVLATVLLSGASQAYSEPIYFSGGFGFRTEQIKEEQGVTPPVYTTDQLRQRIRLNLRGDVKVNADTAVTFRFNTASTTLGVAKMNTLTGWSAGQAISLDLAFVKYTASDMVTLFAGKMINPFYQVNDQIFGSVLTPEGAAVKYAQKFNTSEVFFSSGMLWLLEDFDTTDAGQKDNDVQIVGNQLGVNYKTDTWNALAVVSSYMFNSIQGRASPTGTFGGNTIAGGNFVYGYNLTAIGFEVGTNVSEMPLTVFAESSTNGAEGVSNNKTATTFGIKLNRLKEKGSWNFTLDTRDVQKDSVVGILTDGDVGASANLKMLRARFGYQLASGANVMFSYYDGKKNTATMATAAGSADTGSVATKSNKMLLDFNFFY